VWVKLKGETGPKSVTAENFRTRNPFAVFSFILGLLTGLNGILSGSGYYFAGYPAHGPVGVFGIFLFIFGSLTILSSFFVLRKKMRIVGGVGILVFGLISNMELVFTTTYFTVIFLPILSFVYAVYASKST
jgi:hypothetical protein